MKGTCLQRWPDQVSLWQPREFGNGNAAGIAAIGADGDPICGSAESATGSEIKRGGGTDRLSSPPDPAEH